MNDICEKYPKVNQFWYRLFINFHNFGPSPHTIQPANCLAKVRVDSDLALLQKGINSFRRKPSTYSSAFDGKWLTMGSGARAGHRQISIRFTTFSEYQFWDASTSILLNLFHFGSNLLVDLSAAPHAPQRSTTEAPAAAPQQSSPPQQPQQPRSAAQQKP